MSKKMRLGVCAMLTVLIVVGLYFGMNALQNMGLLTKNRVFFQVTEIEGSFYADVTGYKGETANDNTFDLVFEAGYEDAAVAGELGNYYLRNGSGVDVPQGQEINYQMREVEFDKEVDMSTVTYSYAFINPGEADVAVSFEANAQKHMDLVNKGVQISCEYEVVTNYLNDTLTEMPSQLGVNATPVQGAIFSEVLVPAAQENQGGLLYNYIVVQYTLTVNTEVVEDFKGEIELKFDLVAIAPSSN